MFALAEDEHDASIATMRSTIAFYGSTPAYRPVLDHHGWPALGEELHAMSRRGEWQKMGDLIDDDVLHTFAVVGPPRQVGAEILGRFGGLVDRIQIAVDSAGAHAPELIDALRG
jgi:hypothetical protein